MNSAISERKFLGYQVTHYSAYADILHGEAEVNGEPVSHLLSRGIRRDNACDVGRDEDNELVWIHPEMHEEPPTSTHFFSAPENNALPIFDSPQENLPTQSDFLEKAELKKFGAHSVWELLRQTPRKILFAAGVVVVATVVGVTMVGTPQAKTESVSQAVELPTNSSTVATGEPEQAALDFVLSGQVEGVTVSDEISSQQLSAHVVSRSGEIVLVEVQLDAAGSLTTFATLLLQKTGATWRIRQVFDPR